MSNDGGHGRRDSAGVRQSGPAVKAEEWIVVGLEIQSLGESLKQLGSTLAETGRLGRKVDYDQFSAEFAGLIPIVNDTIDDLETLKIGLRAQMTRLANEAKHGRDRRGV